MNYYGLLTFLIVSQAFADDCQSDKQILEVVAGADKREEQPVIQDDELRIQVGLELNSLAIVSHTNKLHMDLHLLQSWTDPSLYFSHLNPCHSIINMGRHQNLVWTPDEMLSNAEDVHSHRKRAHMKLTQNGTVYWIHRLQQNIPCRTHAYDYPFGNTTCSLIWRNEALQNQQPHISWDLVQQESFLMDSTFKEIGDLVFAGADFETAEYQTESGTHEELVLNLHFHRGEKKIILLFFLPTIMFMMISWLTLCLGPMAITRSILLMTTLLLLMIHYSMNMAGLPETTGITAIDVWKIFSFLFVVAILIELIMVTCMVSAGRSRGLCGCCGSNRKGRYSMEPYYEELNDLRQKKHGRTCGCCRYTALFCDFSSVFFFAVIFIVFTVFYYFKGAAIVKFLNEVNVRDLKVTFD